MTRLSPRHPRYASLVTRARLARASRTGLVVPEGLIAQGRGETFDYFLGEGTSPSARHAEHAAAVWLVNARHPVLSVNGNVAALAAREVAALARALPTLRVEVNLFHRSPARVRALTQVLRSAGVAPILGQRPTARLPGLDSDRARIDRRGIAEADVCLVPLEDGDRALALRRAGKRVVAIDLNPLSRTARAAHIPIVDELVRALRALAEEVGSFTGRRAEGRFPPFDRERALADAIRTMSRRLTRAAATRRGGARAARRPSPRTGRRSRRTR